MNDGVTWLDQADNTTATALVGAKMGRLRELLDAGVVVPQGFSVNIEAYRAHVAQSGLGEVIDDLIASLGPDPEWEQVKSVSEKIRSEFETRPVSTQLARAIGEAYEELCVRLVDVNVSVAVRSSATGEDANEASFAGIFDTYLGISGAERVLHAIQKCWGSLFTPRAVDYRLRRNISHLDMPMAVGVIELIRARCSGVAFSAHPISGKADRVVVEGNWGLGESVVSGAVTPDHIEVGKSDGRVLRYDMAEKDVVSAFDFAQGTVVEMAMPERLRNQRILDDEQISEIVRSVRKIEEHYGYPVDVEWVLARHRRPGDPVTIVQTRPITVAIDAAPPTQTWDPVARFGWKT